ncbi:MAG TPA: hypothetical protein VHB20_14665 [Verrucomicrobiae bacterium]|jgi:hypothetical protein|nr:hypothetical protein [Verrucomicrobiae bacterium]
MPYAPTDFFSQDEVTSLEGQLQNTVDTVLLQDLLADSVQKVRDYTLKYNIEPARQKRLVRALVKFEAYKEVGPVPSQIQTAWDDAMRELREIRDNKFPDLLIQAPADPALAAPAGSFGGRRRIRFGGLPIGGDGSFAQTSATPLPDMARQGTLPITGYPTDAFTVRGLGLNFQPVNVVANVMQPAGALQIFCTIVAGSLSNDGFTVTFSGIIDRAGYQISYSIS